MTEPSNAGTPHHSAGATHADKVCAKPTPRRVAVIGVHGIAHHDPGETANAMADLLLSLPSYDPKKAGTPCAEDPPREFDHFDSTGIQISLRPVCIDQTDRIDTTRNQRVPPAFRVQEGSFKFAQHLAQQEGETERGEVSRSWTVKLLQDYYGAADGNKYVTARLDGQRKDATEVHIYEMFWADLARPTNSVLSFLLALFQFILHLPSLSRVAIDTRPDPDWSWKVFQALHRYAVRVLQMVLPLTKLLILVVLLGAIPAVTQVEHLDIISSVLAGIVIAIAGFLLMNYRLKPIFKLRTGWLLASFLLPALVALGLLAYFRSIPKHFPDQSIEIVVLAIVCWVVGAGLVWWALNAYQSTRPGIQGWGWSFYAVVLVVFIVFWVRAWGPGDESLWVRQASVWTSQWLLVFLRLSWISLALLAILASIFGAIARRRAGTQSEKAQARAAVRTSRFALAVPSFLFVLVTSLIWAALFSMGQKINDPFFKMDVLVEEAPHPHWFNNFDLFPSHSVVEGFPDDCVTPSPKCPGPGPCSCTKTADPDYLKGVLAWSVGYGSYIVVLVAFAGLIVLVWWALPSVLTETFPPRRGLGWYRHHAPEPPRNSTNHDAEWMGAWTTRGLDSISLVTWLTWGAIFLIPLVFMYVGPLTPMLESLRAHSQFVTKQVVCRLLAVASTTAILAALVHNSSPILRVILDVDTYLRTGPIEGTPRAKIFERYVSLLRHIARYQGADKRGYDHVVIVAHSLGALISGDLLNFLQHQKNDPDLQKFGFGQAPDQQALPIRLFTMGNPVRQLLNRFFPYLYDWVRTDPDNGARPLPAPSTMPPQSLDDSALPDPADLGVEKWVSAYRSGDYVGRSLWLNEWYRRTTGSDQDGFTARIPTKVSDAIGTRVEFCIGAGAHTHYWDDTAPDIANQLNELI